MVTIDAVTILIAENIGIVMIDLENRIVDTTITIGSAMVAIGDHIVNHHIVAIDAHMAITNFMDTSKTIMETIDMAMVSIHVVTTLEETIDTMITTTKTVIEVTINAQVCT